MQHGHHLIVTHGISIAGDNLHTVFFLDLIIGNRVVRMIEHAVECINMALRSNRVKHIHVLYIDRRTKRMTLNQPDTWRQSNSTIGKAVVIACGEIDVLWICRVWIYLVFQSDIIT